MEPDHPDADVDADVDGDVNGDADVNGASGTTAASSATDGSSLRQKSSPDRVGSDATTIDTAKFDTAKFDTAKFDTATFDTATFDTATFVARALDEVPIDDLAGLSADELEAVVAHAEVVARRLHVLTAAAIREYGRRGAHRRDGHRNIAAWCSARLRWGAARATRYLRNAEALHHLPEVREQACRGRVPIDHLDDLGRAVANPRVHHHLADADPLFARLLQHLPHWQWRAALRRWLQLADADGSESRHATCHEERHASCHVVGDMVHLEASGGTLEGSFIAAVLDRYAQAEFLADCDDAKQRLGTDRITAADLCRTNRQRRFDALLAICRQAADNPHLAANPDPLVNIVVDDDTAARLTRLLAGEPTRPRIPTAFLEHRCETIDGTPLAESAVAAAMLAGRLRRVLVAPDGVVIDMGRQRRLFSGNARDAALLSHQRCFWPGCRVPTQHCQTDHLLEWSRGGPTSPRNAGRACQHHNLFRSAHGYRVSRDSGGQFHITRPDGTDISDVA